MNFKTLGINVLTIAAGVLLASFISTKLGTPKAA